MSTTTIHLRNSKTELQSQPNENETIRNESRYGLDYPETKEIRRK